MRIDLVGIQRSEQHRPGLGAARELSLHAALVVRQHVLRGFDLAQRNEPNLHALPDRARNAPKHGQRVPFIVVVLESRDDRVRCAYEVR